MVQERWRESVKKLYDKQEKPNEGYLFRRWRTTNILINEFEVAPKELRMSRNITERPRKPKIGKHKSNPQTYLEVKRFKVTRPVAVAMSRGASDRCWSISKLNLELQESWLLPTERASAVKTRMNGLSCGEKNHDNTFSRFDTIPACDRQTDGRTEFG